MSSSKTTQNLAAAFAGESQANRKYLAFAEQAEKEGYPKIAKLFRTIAEAETLHALSHFKTMGGVESTQENLQAALEGETYEFTEMYPAFIKDAQADGQKEALRFFNFANEAEKVHEHRNVYCYCRSNKSFYTRRAFCSARSSYRIRVNPCKRLYRAGGIQRGSLSRFPDLRTYAHDPFCLGSLLDSGKSLLPAPRVRDFSKFKNGAAVIKTQF